MKRLFLLFLVIFFLQNVSAQTNPTISETDRIRLAEAFQLSEKFAEKAWKDWSKTAFAVLLVTPENEFLIRHPSPTKDFREIGFDNLLKSKIFWRKRNFNQSFLATFPAVNGVSTVVVGQAENTFVKTSTPWVVTLLHEHFHQFQTQGNYYNDVNALDLANGDTSGMWMLNYAFPYSDEKVSKRFEELCRKLTEILENSDKKKFTGKLTEYLALRKDFQNSLKGSDYRYFSFQAWQEGVARYTELKIAEFASKGYQSNREFTQLKDFKSYKIVAGELKNKIIKDLKNMKLAQYQRTAFYPFGAGEALLLDKANKSWKLLYNSQKFYLEEYFSPKKPIK